MAESNRDESARKSTAPLLDTNTSNEWGRTAADMPRCGWKSIASEPGKGGAVDPKEETPKRPDFKAPDNAVYDVSGPGENEQTPFSAERGKMPDANKKENWA